MEQVVYGDVLFLINFSMDLLSLYAAGRIMHRKISLLALVLSASIGAVYAIASLFYSGSQLLGAIIHISIAFLLCYISFGGTFSSLCKTVCVFFGVNFLLGGGISALYYAVAHGATHRVYMGGAMQTVYSSVPPGYFIITAAAVGALAVFCGRIFAKKRASAPVTVKIWGCGQSVCFESLCDTGNLLRDPYNGKPVIITGYVNVLPILPFDTKELFRTGDPSVLDRVDKAISHRVHLIPASSIGGDGLLLVYIPDKVTVSGQPCDACIGILPTQKENNFGGYPAITPSVLC